MGRTDEIPQRSHPEKYASSDRHDPNTDSPYARHCIRERHTQQTERSVWCVHEEQAKHSKRTETSKAPNNQENDQKDAREEYHPVEQQMAEC